MGGGGEGYHAHHVAVLGYARDDRGHHDGEGGRVARGVDQAGRHHELRALGRGDGPVVVLARAVDAGEGLLLEERGEAVARGGLLDDLHHHEVLVHLRHHRAEVLQQPAARSQGPDPTGWQRAWPRTGAISYWLGATSRWRVFRGMPRARHCAWISFMQASAGWALESPDM